LKCRVGIDWFPGDVQCEVVHRCVARQFEGRGASAASGGEIQDVAGSDFHSLLVGGHPWRLEAEERGDYQCYKTGTAFHGVLHGGALT